MCLCRFLTCPAWLQHSIFGTQHDTHRHTCHAHATCCLPRRCAPLQVVSKLAQLERALTDLGAHVSSKADDAAARELERRVAALARQADVTGEGMRTLTATAFKRLDEHASGLQRLTMVRLLASACTCPGLECSM